MTAYEQGFKDKCTELGVDPAALSRIKQAPVKGSRVPSTPVAPAVTNVPAATPRPKYTRAQIEKMVREWPKDPSAQKIEFAPGNWWQNVKTQFRKAWL